MNRSIGRLLLLILLLGGPAVMHAQDAEGSGGRSAGISRKQQLRTQAKKERREKKELRKEEKRLLKQHLAHQDKATRKRMKRHQRSADKHGQGRHREPFLSRLFGHKH